MITDYASLQSEIAAWLHRTDLTSRIPQFIANAEARFNRKLRMRQQETAFASVALTDGAAALPTDFEEFKALWVDASPVKPLQVATSEFVRSRAADAGSPVFYAIEGGNVICWPSAGNIKGIYYAKVPSLSDSNTTNWLLTLAPDLYLAESLVHASIFIKNDARAQALRIEADRLRDEVVSAGKAQSIGGGQLTVRVR